MEWKDYGIEDKTSEGKEERKLLLQRKAGDDTTEVDEEDNLVTVIITRENGLQTRDAPYQYQQPDASVA